MSDISSICILRLSAIGDTCHVISVVQAIQQNMPHVKITWVVGQLEYQFLEGLKGVEFIVFDKRTGKAGRAAFAANMRERKFDVLLHMQLAFRASLLARLIPAKRKIGFNFARAKELQWWFTNEKIAAQSRQHVLDGLMGFAHQLGVPNNTPKWQFEHQSDVLAWTDEIIADRPVLVVNAAASRDFRNWVPSRYASVIDYAVKQYGYAVVLTGGPVAMEQALANNIVRECHSEVLNLVGKTSLKQLACLIDKANVVVAPDTGPLHIASVMNTPAIGLYANSNPDRTGPYRWRQYVANKYPEALNKATGKTVEDVKWGFRLKDVENMALISVEDVCRILDSIVQNHYNH